MTYLLDTNICIALMNGTSSHARLRYAQAVADNESLATSVIVLHELWYGVFKGTLFKKNSARLKGFLESNLTLLDYSENDSIAAGEIRADLERRGTRIGEYDTLIAGQALARGLTLVTANTREFNRVKGLKVEDWTVER